MSVQAPVGGGPATVPAPGPGGPPGPLARRSGGLALTVLAVLAITGCDFFTGRPVDPTAPCARWIVGFDTTWVFNDARTDSLLIETSRWSPPCEGAS